ncbi:MAG: MraY family glycosyltransferase [Eubacteriales bacterium]
MNNLSYIYLLIAIVCAGLISFTMTPIVRVFAFKTGAIDVPKDERRMHSRPIPRLGGLAVFAGFSIASMVFCDMSPSLLALWFGGLIIVTLGALDDIFRLNSLVKLAVQIMVAIIPVSQGLTIKFINLFGQYIVLGSFEIPVTIIWIVGLTNAINLIDGLDGLSCGVSAICSLSLLLCTIMLGNNPEITIITGMLAGACLGFLPFNTNPAKIFIGDTGALFLGYTLSVLSLEGLFKTHTVLSFMIPLSIFGLPLFDTLFAIIRRILKGKNPFTADRGHIHHRLIDMGFNQKQSVGILYSVCGILGIAAVMFTMENLLKTGIIIVTGISIFFVNYYIIKNPMTREQSGLDLTEAKINAINAQILADKSPKTEKSLPADEKDNE